jgi:glycosyltransferase involved in cell wall biosynthesis
MPNDIPRVSIIIPTYNYGRFIEDALDSVFNQDVPADRLEVIVVDDGSTDKTKEVVKKRFGRRLTYIYQDNRGVPAARNTGISAARGEIITFLDADDRWSSERIRKVAKGFMHSDIGIVYHNFGVMDSTGKTLAENFYRTFNYKENRSGSILTDILEGKIFCGGSSFAFRKELLKGIHPLPEGIRRGIDFYITAVASCHSYALWVPETLGKYRLHGNNKTFYVKADLSIIAEQHRDFSITYKAALDAISRIQSVPESDVQRLRKRYLRSLLLSCLMSGEKRRAMGYLPEIFKLSSSSWEIASSTGLSIMALLPKNLYPGMIKLNHALKKMIWERWK